MWLFLPPTDEDLSVGTPLRKKPLECEVSIYSNSENTIAGSVMLLAGSATMLLAGFPQWLADSAG
jgi:hypothetical protein